MSQGDGFAFGQVARLSFLSHDLSDVVAGQHRVGIGPLDKDIVTAAGKDLVGRYRLNPPVECLPGDPCPLSLCVRDHFPQAFAAFLQPVIENRDVRAYAKVTHTQIKVVLCLVHAVDLSPWRHTHSQTGLNDPALHRLDSS